MGPYLENRYAVPGLMLLAVAVRLFFWSYTDRAWEDALTTVLHAENASRGLGLTHVQPDGHAVQGFTSALSVLVPLAGDLVRTGFGLTLIKLVSALCGALAVWLGMAIGRRLGLAAPLCLMIGGFLALEHHQILWGMAGMETQMVVVCYLLALLCYIDGSVWKTGLALGLCLLARPDAVLLVGVVMVFESWRAWQEGSIRRVLAIGTYAAAVIVPWLVFTTWYYGSPLPNTIVAKSLGYGMPAVQYTSMSVADILRAIRSRVAATFWTFSPCWGGNGTGFAGLYDHFAIALLALGAMLFGLKTALRKRDVAALPIFAISLVYAAYFSVGVPRVFGWYVVPIVAVSVIGVAYGLRTLRPRAMIVAATAFVLVHAVNLAITFPAERRVQQIVEDGGRKQIGLFLGSVMKPGETVGTECLGYVSYYSRRIVYDFPGLCSRAVVEFLKTHPDQRSLPGMLAGLRPTYIVARDTEIAQMNSWLPRDYDPVKVFQVPDAQAAQLLLRDWNVDLKFTVFRSKSSQ